jgi:hypothetical protein
VRSTSSRWIHGLGNQERAPGPEAQVIEENRARTIYIPGEMM